MARLSESNLSTPRRVRSAASPSDRSGIRAGIGAVPVFGPGRVLTGRSAASLPAPIPGPIVLLPNRDSSLPDRVPAQAHVAVLIRTQKWSEAAAGLLEASRASF